MSKPRKPAGSRWMHELEERVAELLDLEPDERAAGFRALREEHPDHADLLHRWELSADLVLDAAEDVPPSVDLGGGGEGTREHIGEYRVLRRLGEGGMGIVYLAERASDRQRVALKVVRQGLSSRDILTRFEAEASALRRLSHPNIAALVDSGTTEDGRPYFAMRYVPGLAIHEYCDRQQVDVRGRVALLRQACLGVQHAHEHGVLHRDLKPSNILVQNVRGDPEPVIIDFGVARALSGRLADRTLFTEHGRLLGTPEYMSPEQAEMSELEVNLRSDVYSLGVVLFELLTGELPFSSGEVRKGGRRGVAETLRHREPPLPSARVADAADSPDGEARARLRGLEPADLDRVLRSGLDWIVMRCLEKDPARRYPSARALADDMGRWLDGRPVEAGPPGLGRHCGRWLRRHRPALAAAGALAVFGAAAWLASRPASPQPDQPTSTRALARFEIPTAAAPRPPIARRQVDFATNGLRAVHVVDGVEGAPDSLAIWDESYGHSRPLAAQTGGFSRLNAPRWSPGADRIAFVGARQDIQEDWERQVFVCPAEGGTAVPVLPAPVRERLIDVCWLPDGSGLVCADADGPVFALGLDGVRASLPSPGQCVGLGGITADGRWLVCSALAAGFITGPRDLWVVPMQGGAPRVLTTLEGSEEYPRLAADDLSVWFIHTIGRSSAVDDPRRGSSNVHSLLFDPATGSAGASIQHTHYDDLELCDLAFVRGGDDVVWRSRYQASAVRCRSGASPPRTLGQGTQVQVAADGSLVCFVDWNLAQRAIVGCAPDGSEPPGLLASVDGFDSNGFVFRLRPDGVAAAVSGVHGGGPGVFAVDLVPGGAGAPQRVASTGSAVTPTWSPDGSRLAWCDGGRLWVHDFATGATQELGLQVFEWEPWSVTWSPDGAEVAATAYSSAYARDETDTNTVYAVAWPSGTVRSLTPAGDPYKEDVRWHPSGTFLSAIYSNHALCRIERDGSGISVLLDDSDHIEYRGRWNGAGTQFILQCLGCRNTPDLGAHCYDLATGQLVLDAQGAKPYASQSLDGTVVAWNESTLQEHFEWLRDVRD